MSDYFKILLSQRAELEPEPSQAREPEPSQEPSIKHIYLKIGSKIYNETETEKIKAKYYNYTYFLSILRITKRIIKRDLADYPEIDIIINFKNVHNVLGRFCKNTIIKHKEYNFIKGNNPYIVLFWHCIESYYNYKNVKGFNSVLLHEYGHFKQWLNGERLGHSKGIKARATGQAEKDLRQHISYINQKRG